MSADNNSIRTTQAPARRVITASSGVQLEVPLQYVTLASSSMQQSPETEPILQCPASCSPAPSRNKTLQVPLLHHARQQHNAIAPCNGTRPASRSGAVHSALHPASRSPAKQIGPWRRRAAHTHQQPWQPSCASPCHRRTATAPTATAGEQHHATSPCVLYRPAAAPCTQNFASPPTCPTCFTFNCGERTNY